MMKQILIVAAACIAVAGCQKDGTRAQQQLNQPFVIAEVDGVKLYKVKDDTPGGAGWVYFTTRGDVSWQRSCGKNCTERMQIPGATP